MGPMPASLSSLRCWWAQEKGRLGAAAKAHSTWATPAPKQGCITWAMVLWWEGGRGLFILHRITQRSAKRHSILTSQPQSSQVTVLEASFGSPWKWDWGKQWGNGWEERGADPNATALVASRAGTGQLWVASDEQDTQVPTQTVSLPWVPFPHLFSLPWLHLYWRFWSAGGR